MHRIAAADPALNSVHNKAPGSDALKKNHEAGQVVLPYLEEELQPKRMPAWLLAIFVAFVLGALLFPFYA